MDVADLIEAQHRKQGQSFLETLVMSDSDLREHLVSIGSQTLHSEYVSRLYDANGILAPVLLGCRHYF